MSQPVLIPHNRENEMAVLGCMILNQAIAVEVMSKIGGSDFYEPKNELIFNTVGRLIGNGSPVEPQAVLAALGADLGRIGGAGYIHDCLSMQVNVMSGPYYAELVADDATRRRIIVAGSSAQLAAAQTGTDIAACIDTAEQAMLTATRYANRREHPSHIAIVGAEALDKLRIRIAGNEPTGIPTGLTEYDDLVTHRSGQMIVVGARPGMGKSTLTQQMGWHSAGRHNRRTVIISLEMTVDDMVFRLASDMAEIDSQRIDRGQVSPAEQRKIDDAEREWRDWPLELVDWCQTWPAIRNYIRRYVAKNGGIDMFIIDFLQRITPTDAENRTESRNLVVGRWADEIKSLALETGAIAVVASQLRREGGANRPTMSDLRESGQIEQAADVVTLIHRPDYYNPDNEPGIAELIVAKHRRGPTADVRVKSELDFSRFVDGPTARQQNRENASQDTP